MDKVSLVVFKPLQETQKNKLTNCVNKTNKHISLTILNFSGRR